MKNLAATLTIIIVVSVVLGYMFCLPPKNDDRAKPGTKQEVSQSSVKEVYGYKEDSAEYNAIMLIGLDDGGKLPYQSDERIKPTAILLQDVSNKAKEMPQNISASLDSISDLLKIRFNKTISRQQLLLDSNSMLKLGDKKAMEGQKFKDLLQLWAVMKYSK